MNRFTPDTWRDALFRPLAMAAPDAGVYAEIIAPDLRFLFIAILGIALLVLVLLRKRVVPGSRATWVLMGAVALAFVPWLATTGNGRYFLPFLLVAGPLCLGLALRLPLRKRVTLVLGLGMLVLQGVVVLDSKPWRSWGLGTWGNGPYFEVALRPEMKALPATYVTMTSISYSLIAPLFHPQSRWINISALPEDPARSIEASNAHKIFSNSGRLFLVVPSMPKYMTSMGLPSVEMLDVIDRQLGPQRLAVKRSASCELISSRGLARVVVGNPAKVQAATLEKLGFWICPLQYPVPVPSAPQLDATLNPVFEKIEHDCPRFFPPGTGAPSRVANGVVRNYSGADMKLYVLDDGAVYYKYWRAMNPEQIAPVAKVLSPEFRMSCDNIRGRSGLPWERVL